MICFNSRTHAGCDLKLAREKAEREAVSIHAPTRGATYSAFSSVSRHKRFQFTHPRGVRPEQIRDAVLESEFQFTHPRGVRLRGEMSFQAPELFQFTHPRGVRRQLPGFETYIREFQFTHPRGVRLLNWSKCQSKLPFQFTHPRGVRLVVAAGVNLLFQFQFTHPRGVRRTLLGFLIINELSNIICEVNNFIPNFKYIFQYY